MPLFACGVTGTIPKGCSPLPGSLKTRLLLRPPPPLGVSCVLCWRMGLRCLSKIDMLTTIVVIDNR